jgi:HK97 family phage major capsid protein
MEETTMTTILSPEYVRQFSLSRFIQQLMDPYADGYELELSRAMTALADRDVRGSHANNRRTPEGSVLPWEVLARDATTELDAGGALVGEDAAAAVPAIRPTSVVARLGCTVMTGLVGDTPIPEITTGAEADFVGEGEAVPSVTPATGSILMTPHTCGCYCDIERKLLKQSNPRADLVIEQDLRAAIGALIDWAVLHGAGYDDQPLGIANTAGVETVAIGTNGGAPAFSHLVDLADKIVAADGDTARVAYLTSPVMQRKLLQTWEDTSASRGDRIWRDPIKAGSDGTIAGRPAYVSGHVEDTLTKGSSSDCSAIFAGIWSDVAVGIWGSRGIDLIVDTATHSSTGKIRLVALMDVDVGLRHRKSFARILDARASA